MHGIEWRQPRDQYEIELGTLVRDVVTGFEGIAMARVEYLTGCTQYGISQAGTGEMKGCEYLDWQRLEYDPTKTRLHALRTSEASRRGDGPSEAPGHNKMAPAR